MRMTPLEEIAGERAVMGGRGYSAVALYNPKSGENIGGTMRACHVYGASLVVIGGGRRKMVRHCTDVTKAWRHIPVQQIENPLEATPYDCVPVAVEIASGATMLPTYKHPQRAFYLFGPEDGSLPKWIIERCRDLVFVPTVACMNLAATVNVVLYDRMAKQ